MLSFPKPPGNQGPSIIQHKAAGNGGVGGGKSGLEKGRPRPVNITNPDEDFRYKLNKGYFRTF